jgi:hypothetical protein
MGIWCKDRWEMVVSDEGALYLQPASKQPGPHENNSIFLRQTKHFLSDISNIAATGRTIKAKKPRSVCLAGVSFKKVLLIISTFYKGLKSFFLAFMNLVRYFKL